MLLTTAQVADRLHVSIKTVRRLVDRGELTAIRPTPRVLRFDAVDIARFLEERTEAAS